MGRNTDVGVNAEAGNSGTTRAGGNGEVLQIDLVADLGEAPSGTRARDNPPGNRSAVEFGEQGLVVQERIRFGGIVLRPQPATFQELVDAAPDALGHPRHFGIAGRGHGPESDFAPLSNDVDASSTRVWKWRLRFSNRKDGIMRRKWPEPCTDRCPARSIFG